MGKFEALTKFLKLAPQYADDGAKLLSQVDNPELATKLVGEPRADYLKLLDDVYGDKAKRAADMGFGNKTYYHGTNIPIEQFSKEALGNNTKAESAAKGFFFTDNPIIADDYAQAAIRNGANQPEKIELSKLNKIHSDLRNDIIKKYGSVDAVPEGEWKKLAPINEQITAQYKKAKALERYWEQGKQSPYNYDVKLKQENPLVYDYQSAPRTEGTEFYKKLDEAVKNKNDSTRFLNAYDGVGSDILRLPNRPASEIATVFEPNQIRSTDAAFDPRFKDSGLIMAGAAAIPQADMSPVPFLKQAANAYNKVKNAVYEPLANQLDLTKDKSAKDDIQSLLSTFADPVNLVPGAAGVALGGLQMLGDDDKEIKTKVLSNLQNQMDERTINDLKQRKQRGW